MDSINEIKETCNNHEIIQDDLLEVNDILMRDLIKNVISHGARKEILDVADEHLETFKLRMELEHIWNDNMNTEEEAGISIWNSYKDKTAKLTDKLNDVNTKLTALTEIYL